MGKLIHDVLRRIKDIVRTAGVPVCEAGELGIQGNGPKNLMKPKLFLCDEINPVGGQRRDFGLAGKGVAFMHAIARRHLYKEILSVLSLKGLEQPEVIRNNDKSLTPCF
jgi:hypothetical protein